jgi:transposase-like protein
MAEISQELGIHLIILYKWGKAWRLQGKVVPASQNDPEGWGPAEKVHLGTGDRRPERNGLGAY